MSTAMWPSLRERAPGTRQRGPHALRGRRLPTWAGLGFLRGRPLGLGRPAETLSLARTGACHCEAVDWECSMCTRVCRWGAAALRNSSRYTMCNR
jgi:hypothetical protein